VYCSAAGGPSSALRRPSQLTTHTEKKGRRRRRIKSFENPPPTISLFGGLCVQGGGGGPETLSLSSIKRELHPVCAENTGYVLESPQPVCVCVCYEVTVAGRISLIPSAAIVGDRRVCVCQSHPTQKTFFFDSSSSSQGKKEK
jgi:hypothetical protein